MISLKNITLSCLIVAYGFCSTSLAARDSVAVFYKPEKTGVLLNERGSNGRIQQFMNTLGIEENIYWLNEDESINIRWSRIYW